jgi:serine protease
MKGFSCFTLIFVVLGLWLGLLQQAWAQSHPSFFTLPSHTEHVSGQILFKIHPQYRAYCQEDKIDIPGLSQRIESLQPLQLRKNFRVSTPAAKRNPSGVPDLSLVYELQFRGPLDLEMAINHLLGHPAVSYAEPRYIYATFLQPNDPLADTTGGGANQWYLAQIMAREAWDLSTGDTSVVIGVTDSGISFLHPDLRKNLAINLQDPPDGIDNDGDGYVDNFRGWDFAGLDGNGFGDNDPSHVSKHGVSVTGISSATPNNGIGSAGTAYHCRYLPVKASPDSRPDAITHGYESVLYAAQQGAQVINCSWGGRVRSQLAEDVIDYVTLVHQAGVVAACGNTPRDLRFYPAAFDKVLSVTNLQFDDTVCCPGGLGTTYSYSVDVGAPGWKLSGPTGNSSYEGFSGTSAASPVAAAVVGITCAYFPDYTGFQAAQRVRVTTDAHYQIPFNQEFAGKLGTGRVNMYRALTDPRKPSIRLQERQITNQQGDHILLPGDTVEVLGQFINYLDPSSAQLKLSLDIPNQSEAGFIELLEPDFGPGVVGENQIFDNASQPFRLRIRPGTPENLQIGVRLTYTDSSLAYQDFQYFEVLINPTLINITQNQLKTSLTSESNFGYRDYPSNQVGLGVQYRGNERSGLFEGGFLIGKGPNQVSANLRDAQGVKAHDFVRLERARVVPNPQLADFEATAIFTDQGASQPLSVRVSQHVYAWSNLEDQDYIIFDYIIHNDGNQPLTGLYAGMYANWNISDSTRNASFYRANEQLVFAQDIQLQDPTLYAMSLLSPGNFRAFAGEVGSSDFSDQGYWQALTNTPTFPTATAGTNGFGANIWHLLGQGPFAIAPNDSYRIGFALLAATNVNSLVFNREKALRKYKCYVLGEGPIANFRVEPLLGRVSQPVQFYDENPSAVSWAWDFGDGSTSILKSPTHTYQQVGNYPVSLKVSDGTCSVLRKENVRVTYPATQLQDLELFSLQLYPNPGDGKFYLQSGENQSLLLNFRLLDTGGNVILEKRNQRLQAGQAILLDLSKQAAGLYLLDIQTPSGRKSLKLMRK